MDKEVLTIIALGLVFVGAIVPRIGLDLVAILALGVLVLGDVITPDQAAAGFGNTTMLTVACMFVLAAALQQTGAVEAVTTLARRRGRRGMRPLLIALLPVVMLLSAVMSNTAVVVLLLPALLTVSMDLDIPASRLLIPLSYAAILGGTLTLVGTTTNLLVNGIARGQGLPGLELLDFLPMGLVFSAIGLVYLVVVAPRLLPDRVGLSTLVARSMRSDYLTEVVLGPTSVLVGQRLADVPDLVRDIRLLQLVRGEVTRWPPFTAVELRAGDLLQVKGPPERIVDLLQQRGVEGPTDAESGGRIADVTRDLAEVMVPPGSTLDGATVAEAGLRQRFGVTILGVLRRETHLRAQLGSLTLRVGDTLLVQGDEADLSRLADAGEDLLLIGGPRPHAPRRHRSLYAVLVSGVALLLAALQIVPLSMAVLLASVALVAGKCLSSGQAYRSIDLGILVVLGCMLGVGLAVQQSGLAHDVAGELVRIGSGLGPTGVLAAIYLATMVLTEIVTNAGTASVMVPIAIEAARLEGVKDPKAFILAVALAASCSLLTPIGYQTNLLIYGPGGYRFTDYTRVGLPLALLLWIAAVALLPLIFPFDGV